MTSDKAYDLGKSNSQLEELEWLAGFNNQTMPMPIIRRMEKREAVLKDRLDTHIKKYGKSNDD